MTGEPALVVRVADGREFTRRSAAPQFPPDASSYEQWARFLAAAIQLVLAAEPGPGMEAMAQYHATRDFARDALLGWSQWSETPR